jgi:serine protease
MLALLAFAAAQPSALVKLRGHARAELMAGDVAELAARADVEWAEPDRVRTRMAEVVPNDPMFAAQWALPLVHAPEAWARTTGSSSVVVAVVDTGIRAHPDLADRLLPGWDFIRDPKSAGDGDGRDADPTDAGDTTDGSSALHGLHVAGIIGAESNNGIGVSGVDWACRILPVRALGVKGGAGLDSDIADAIRWAAGLHVDGVPENAHPADVINLSFGGSGRSQALQEAVNDAVERGAIVVAAAGNFSRDARNDSPAGLDHVIAVGAVDASGGPAPYSNFGPVVALSAPGGEPSDGVLSTLEGPSGYSYAAYAGTSQAAAFVSATAALMRAIDPTLSPGAARAILATGGTLDVDAALAATAACAGHCTAPPTPTIIGGCQAAPGRVDAAIVSLLLTALALVICRVRPS